MAKTVVDNEQVVRPEWQELLRFMGYGALVGVVYYLAMLMLNQYVVEPLACRTLTDATACVEAPVLAGRLATVVATVVAIGGMIRLSLARPLIVAVATSVLLWNLGAWTEGLYWLEAFAWAIALYALVYGLFGWIVRNTILWFSIVLSLIVVLLISLSNLL